MPEYSSDDFLELCRAIQRYAEEDMDQWDLFRLPTRYGEIFVSVTMQLPEGVDHDSYRPINLGP